MMVLKKGARYSIKIKACYVLLLVLSSGVLFSQDYTFQNFYPAEETYPSYIYSIAQDNSGFLWIAEGSGLIKFNGFRFERFSITDSTVGDFVTCLFNDGENIWCGTNAGFLYYYDGKSFNLINQEGKPYSRINQFLISAEGSLWAVTNESGIIKINLKTKSLKQFMPEGAAAISAIEFINENEIIVGTNSGLYQYYFSKTGELKLIGAINGLSKTSIKSIKRIRNGAGFYVATENDGIFKLIQDNEMLKISFIKTQNNENLDGVQDIWEDLNNNLWLAIRLKMQNQPDSEDVTYFNKRNGFVTDNVKTIFEDREGNIWTGNFGEGLTKVQPLLFSFIPIKDKSYGTSVFSIWPGQKYLWLGTEKGLLRINRETMSIADFYGSGKGLPQDSIMTLFSGNDLDLWIGTSNNGVYLMNKETGRIKRAYSEIDGLKNSIVKITGNNEKVWIGTKKGLRFIDLRNDSVSWFSINEGGLPHNIIHDLYLDSHDKLWITTKSNILSFIENSKITKIPLHSTSGIMSLEAITEDSLSTIWVGSNGNGIFMITADSVFNFTKQEGLLSNYCYSLAADMRKGLAG